MSKLAAALAWAARGFRVFPLNPDEPGKDGNSKRAKEPAITGWTETATTDPAWIKAWWADGGDWNIGVETTGLLVLDVDTKEGRVGMASFMELHGAFDTLTIRTPSGGLHLYYAGADVQNSQADLGPGLDVRSHHGYVLGPGSTIDGVPYTVELNEPIAFVPDHIVARCRAPRSRGVEQAGGARPPPGDLDTPTAVAIAAQRIAATPGAIRGEQSIAAYRVACIVRDLGISEHIAAGLLAQWAMRCEPPIEPDDLRGRVANAYLYAQNAAGAKSVEVQFQGVVVEPLPAIIEPPPATNRFAKFGNAGHPAEVARRPHAFRNFSQLGEVTGLIGEGGAGKSAFSLAAAIFGAVGAGLYGFKNELGPFRSIVYDAEDSLPEMQRRFHACCQHFGIDYATASRMVALVSGRDERFKLVSGTSQSLEVNKDVVRDFIEVAQEGRLGMIALNPLNKLHTASGIDNSQMTLVMDVIEMLAQSTGAFTLLSHHTSKQGFGSSKGYAGNADSSQGASAVKDNIRANWTLMTASEEDANRYGLLESERRSFARLDSAKVNHTRASGQAIWLQRQGVALFNGEDAVVLIPAEMEGRMASMNASLAETLAAALTEKAGGSMNLSEAVKALKAADPLYTQMQAQTVKARIQAALWAGIKVGSGSVLTLLDEGSGATICYQK